MPTTDTNTAAPLAAWAPANLETATERWKSSSNGQLAVATWRAKGADRCEVDALLGTTALPGLVLNPDVAERELARTGPVQRGVRTRRSVARSSGSTAADEPRTRLLAVLGYGRGIWLRTAPGPRRLEPTALAGQVEGTDRDGASTMRRRLTVIGVVVPLALLATPAVGRPAPCATFAAHRGYITAGATENGMRAIRAARAAGAPGVELDLARTSDSYIVLMHDKTIDRTTTGTGQVWDHSRSYLEDRVRLNDGSRIPTLAAVLHYASRSGVRLDLELSSTGGSATVYRRIAAAIQSHAVAGQVTLTSFSAARLRLAAAYIRGVPRALLSRTRVSPAGLRAAAASRAEVRFSSVTSHYVARMHAAGIKVGTWVVNDATAFGPTTATGVDVVTTDNVRAYRAYCDRQP